MHVLVSNYGAYVGKKSERLVVKENGQVVTEIPFYDVEQVTIATSGASLSSDVIRECADQGIQINFVSSAGEPFAKVISPGLTGTVITRREQMKAYDDERGVKFIRATIEGKLRNQGNVLKYFAKYRREADREAYERLYDAANKMEGIRAELDRVDGRCIDDVRAQFMSIEGRGANVYWDEVKNILAPKVDFPGREHRGAADPVNSLLNYGYAILYHQVTGALVYAGLDPFAGFLHVDRPGKLSLAFDFIEEFRPVVVDRLVIAMVTKGGPPEMDGEKLGEASKKEFSARILERFEDQERYESKKHKIKTIIQMQARHLVTFLRREGGYRPFVAGW